MIRQFQTMCGWFRERPRLFLLLLLSSFACAEWYAPEVGVIIACIPGWLAIIWYGWLTEWPTEMEDYWGVPNFVLLQTIQVNKNLRREIEVLFWLCVTMLPVSIVVLGTK